MDFQLFKEDVSDPAKTKPKFVTNPRDYSPSSPADNRLTLLSLLSNLQFFLSSVFSRQDKNHLRRLSIRSTRTHQHRCLIRRCK